MEAYTGTSVGTVKRIIMSKEEFKVSAKMTFFQSDDGVEITEFNVKGRLELFALIKQLSLHVRCMTTDESIASNLRYIADQIESNNLSGDKDV